MLIGLGKMFKNVASTLASTILGYVYTPSPGSGYYTTRVGVQGDGFIGISYSENADTIYSIKNGSTSTANVPFPSVDGLPSVKDIAFGNDTWLIASGQFNSGKIAYSTTGNTWTQVQLPYNTVQKIKFVNNKFFVMGWDNGSPFGNYISISSDGVSWSTTSVSEQYRDIIWNSNISKYVAVGTSKSTATSSNGTTWTENIYGGTNIYTKVFLFGNTMVALANPNGISVSTDGDTWTQYSTTNEYITGAYGNTYGTDRVVLGSQDGYTLYSTDFTNWTEADSLSSIYKIIYVSGFGFVGATGSGVCLYSHSDNSWGSALITSSGSIRDIEHEGNGAIVISGYDGQNYIAYGNIMMSPSGYTKIQTTSLIRDIVLGKINTFVETQISIGGQGSGEQVEALGQVDVYTVPSGKSANISMITIENLSSNQITYDLGIVNTGTDLTASNTLKWDQPIAANSTETILNVTNPVTAGKTIYVFPSAVDQVQVKVYGTETSV